jgi:hypothetical protein
MAFASRQNISRWSLTRRSFQVDTVNPEFRGERVREVAKVRDLRDGRYDTAKGSGSNNGFNYRTPGKGNCDCSQTLIKSRRRLRRTGRYIFISRLCFVTTGPYAEYLRTVPIPRDFGHCGRRRPKGGVSFQINSALKSLLYRLCHSSLVSEDLCGRALG